MALAEASPRYLALEASYALRLVVVPLLLAWAWRWYVPLRGPRSVAGSIAVGLAAGLVGVAAWVVLSAPSGHRGAVAWSPVAFALRTLAAGLVVPIFEEVFIRGFILRFAYQWDQARRGGDPAPLAAALDERFIGDVAPGAWTLPAVIVSAVVFAAGHALGEWPAALAFGVLMAWLWILRKDLLSCVVAHGTANLALALYVRSTGSWGLW